VGKLFSACLGGTVVLLLALVLLGERPGGPAKSVEWGKSLASGESASVLVLLVGDRAGVGAVRAAVDPTRILAETPDAIVLREGRVVATGPEVIGGPLVEAGFAERSIEVWAASRGDPWKRGEGEDQKLSLAALAKKPALTPLEVLAILNGSVEGL
jgi:hypothetical protein